MFEKLNNLYQFLQRGWQRFTNFVAIKVSSVVSFVKNVIWPANTVELQPLPASTIPYSFSATALTRLMNKKFAALSCNFKRSSVSDMQEVKNKENLALIKEVELDELTIRLLVTEIINTLKRFPAVVHCLPVEVMDVDLFIERYRGENNLVGLLESRFRDDISPVDMSIIKQAFLRFKEIINTTAGKLYYKKDIKTETEVEAGVKKFNDKNDERENRKRPK